MHIRFSPMRRKDQLTAVVAGDVLTINGEAFDFSALPEGATLPREAVVCDWLASDVARQNSEICLTLVLPHGGNAPQQTLFPAPVHVPAGDVPTPPYDDEETTT